jgi:hypothetical protein
VGLSASRDVIVSLEPDLSFAAWAAELSSDYVKSKFRVYVTAQSFIPVVRDNCDFELLKDQLIFIAPSAVPTFAQMFVETSAEAQLKQLGLT